MAYDVELSVEDGGFEAEVEVVGVVRSVVAGGEKND